MGKASRFFTLRPLIHRVAPKSTESELLSPPEDPIEDAGGQPGAPVPFRPGGLAEGGLSDDDRNQLLAVLKSHRLVADAPEDPENSSARTALAVRTRTRPPNRKDHPEMASNIDTVLKEAMEIDGAIGVALVDYTSGMTLGQSGGATLNLDVAAAGNTDVVRSKLRTMEALGLREGIEDILITLDTQYHLIRLITDRSGAGLFLYMALDKRRSNLALARRRLANLERTIQI